ncbi:unnamed protein product [Aphanomyces euteiches]
MSREYNIEFEALGINTDQYGALKAAFSKYDKMKTGAIRVADFDHLSKDLGEEYDEQELQVAKSSLEDEAGEHIQFGVFLKWWTEELK